MYYICKKERDAILFQNIQQWELNDVFANIKDAGKKKEYVNQLERERQGLA